MSSLPGQILLILVIAGLLAYPLSFELLRRCRNEIRRLMRVEAAQRAAPAPPEGSGRPVAFQGTSALLAERLRRSPWRTATLHWMVGIVVALYLALLVVASSEMTLTPARVLVTASALAWPGFLSVVMTAGGSSRQRWGVLAVGCSVCLLSGVLAFGGTVGGAVANVSLMWVILNLPPTLYLATFMTRRIRAAGPMVLVVTLLAATGAATTVAFLQGVPAISMRLLAAGLAPPVLAAAQLMIGALVGVCLGAWLLNRFATIYQRNGIGDEGIALSAVWLTFVIFAASFHLLFEGPAAFALGLGAFPLYLILVWAGRRALPSASPPQAGPALLLLRVFDRGGAPRHLFHAVSRHWRHVGPITMIAGHDLAVDAIEPNDLMAYLTAGLHERFVRDPADTLVRLDASPAAPDPDGRYRCQQLFCFKDSWFEIAEGLIARSAVVLIDLRGFNRAAVPAVRTPDNKPGISLELEACDRLGAWSRTVVLHDGNLTEQNTPRSLWRNSAVVKVDGHGARSVDMPRLLQVLATRCLTTEPGPARAT